MQSILSEAEAIRTFVQETWHDHGSEAIISILTEQVIDCHSRLIHAAREREAMREALYGRSSN